MNSRKEVEDRVKEIVRNSGRPYHMNSINELVNIINDLLDKLDDVLFNAEDYFEEKK